MIASYEKKRNQIIIPKENEENFSRRINSIECLAAKILRILSKVKFWSLNWISKAISKQREKIESV